MAESQRLAAELCVEVTAGCCKYALYDCELIMSSNNAAKAADWCIAAERCEIVEWSGSA